MNIAALLLEYAHIYNMTNHTTTIDQHYTAVIQLLLLFHMDSSICFSFTTSSIVYNFIAIFTLKSVCKLCST